MVNSSYGCAKFVVEVQVKIKLISKNNLVEGLRLEVGEIIIHKPLTSKLKPFNLKCKKLNGVME